MWGLLRRYRRRVVATPEPARARLVNLVGAFNFRDLGGYATEDHRRVRWGSVFRSDALHALTTDDVAALESMGVATIVDLRAASEVDLDPLTALSHDVTYRHLPVLKVLGGGPTPTVHLERVDEDLSARYLWYLEEGGDAFVSALVLISQREALPLVFHCTAGKDRTGVLAALLLRGLGVSIDTVVADYEITAQRMPLIIERLRSHPVHGEAVAQMEARVYEAEGRSIRLFVEALEARYGGVIGWANDAGLPAGTFERIADLLLEPQD